MGWDKRTGQPLRRLLLPYGRTIKDVPAGLGRRPLVGHERGPAAGALAMPLAGALVAAHLLGHEAKEGQAGG